jgi:hypothetical protein
VVRASSLRFAVASAAVVGACSSSSQPDTPAANCSYYQNTFMELAPGPNDAGGGDAGSPPAICLPSDVATADASATLACTLLVALPQLGPQSACAAAGFQTPDATTLSQVTTNVPTTQGHPTCLVPACAEASCATACSTGTAAAWCTVGSAGCERGITLSATAVVRGGTYVVGCLEGC